MYISPVNYSFNNVSFLSKRKIPIYAIDLQGNYLKFDSITQAGSDLGIVKQGITQNIAGKSKMCSGYFFVNASEIESTDNQDRVLVDRSKIEEMVVKKTLALNSEKRGRKAKGEIYAIDLQGNYKKYPSRVEAAKELNIASQNISINMSGGTITSGGYFYVDADQVELKDKEGNIFVDEDKIKELANQRLQKQETKVRGKGLYAVDSERKYKKCPSQTKAAQELGISQATISYIVSGGMQTSKGYTFVDAEQVELTDEEGNIFVDEDKIKELASDSSLRNKKVYKEIYAIDSKGHYKKFSSKEEASEYTGIPVMSIQNMLAGVQKISRGLTFVRAELVEESDENNENKVSEEKINGFFKDRFPEVIYL